MINIEDAKLRDAMVSAGASQIVGFGAHSDAYQCIRAALQAALDAGYILVPVRGAVELVESGWDQSDFIGTLP